MIISRVRTWTIRRQPPQRKVRVPCQPLLDRVCFMHIGSRHGSCLLGQSR
jgi:hypothetical protein